MRNIVRTAKRGFTLIELLVAIVIAAILVTLAIGGFGGMFARKRMEGLAADFATDLQQARSEAVSRNIPVRVTFGTNCHVIHTFPTAAVAPSCDGANVVAGAGSTQLKSVQRAADDVTFARQSATNAPSYIQFDNINGTASSDGGSNPGALIGSSAGSWQLRVRVGSAGRVQVCTPNALPGFPAC